MKILASRQVYMTYEDYVASGEFNLAQLYQLKHGFDCNISPKLMSIVADPKFHAVSMRELIYDILVGVPIPYILIYASPEFTPSQIYRLSLAAKTGIGSDGLQRMANPAFNGAQMDIMYIAVQKHLPNAEINRCFEFLSSHSDYMENLTTEIIYWWVDNLDVISDDQFEFAISPQFDEDQAMEILFGYESGLSDAQVQFYADPDIDSETMCTLRCCLERGVSVDALMEYVSPLRPGALESFYEDLVRNEHGGNV